MVEYNVEAKGHELANLSESPKLQDSRGVRAAFGGRSDMWLWRRIHDGTLPAPIYIAGRRYWQSSEIADVIKNLAAASRGE